MTLQRAIELFKAFQQNSEDDRKLYDEAKLAINATYQAGRRDAYDEAAKILTQVAAPPG
jgi:hypothetical protein